ncbi:MAG: signal peptidase I [Candidatus Kerfeldbacteria bacterium]|nr:signal peptidase I [Candidatus Kerfeldbacteria bacterium]
MLQNEKKKTQPARARERELEEELNKLQPSQEKSALKSSLVFFVEILKVVLISLAIIIPVRHFLIQPFIVKGASMEPNFYDHEYLIIDEISYRLHEPERGDVVVIRDPRNTSQFFIKRIIGLAGETVRIHSGQITITNAENPDGFILDEQKYLDSSVVTSGSDTINLRDSEVLVLGDNRGSSLDSRVFGPVDMEKIVGRAWIRAWPLDRLTQFSDITYP